MTVKKHLRPGSGDGERLPCLYLVDSAAPTCRNGRSVPRQDPFRRIFYNQANMSAQGIPQIAW